MKPSHLDTAEAVDFIVKTAIERDPKKRRVKPVDTQASILDFELEESSDDSDFRIEDHPDLSDDDDSINSDGDGNDNSSDGSTEDSDEDSDLNSYKKIKLPSTDLSIADIIEQAKQNAEFGERELAAAQVQICCGCLGDQSDGSNEIVECDACGTTVHEACYGCSDSASLSSSEDSMSPTAPWFCDTCRAGVRNAVCELCPNTGGIFKETDVGRWVHLVCALYVPGVAFGEVDRLSGVTLFEMPYNRWGAKSCCLCPDQRLARTGVCIGCDAGMCKTYFHVTCAQREGFLSEAHTEEVDQADPFYAHCRLHSDKTQVRRRKRNYLALELRTHLRQIQFSRAGHADSEEQVRIQRKLEKERLRYLAGKRIKPPPWVPTQKMPRLLTTSATACRRLLSKAALMGVDSAVQEMHEAHTLALCDIRKKWHIAPAFTVEFIAYYLDRNERMREMKEMLESLLNGNKNLVEEQTGLRTKYDSLLSESSEHQRTNTHLRHLINIFHSTITAVCPSKRLPSLDDLDSGKSRTSNVVNNSYGNMGQANSNGMTVGETTSSVAGNAVRTVPQQMMVPTAAALKMGVGFPLGRREGGGAGGKGRVLSSHARNQASAGPLHPTTPAVTSTNSSSTNSTLNSSSPLSLPINERCGICKQPRDQHLMAKCDTCHLHYHLGCLQPPLTRPPKKSKLYGWQCSECDKTSGEEDGQDEMDGREDGAVQVNRKKAVRRSRTRFSKGEDGGVRELIVDDKDKTETAYASTQGELQNSITIIESPVSASTDSITPEKAPKHRQSKERRKSANKDKLLAIESTESTVANTPDKLPIAAPTPSLGDAKPAKVNMRKTRLSANRMEVVSTTVQPNPTQSVLPPQPIQEQPQETPPTITNNINSNNIDEEVIHIIVDKKVDKKPKAKGKWNPPVFDEPEEIPIDKRIKIVKIKPLEPKSDDVELATPTVTLQLRQYNDKPSPPPSPSPPTHQPSQLPKSAAPISFGSNALTATINSVAMNNTSPPRLDDEATGLTSNGIAEEQQLYVSKPKKRRRDKHRNRYSPDGDIGTVVEKHKRKHKKKNMDIDRPLMSNASNSILQPQLPHPRITIKIKSIPLPAGEVASVSNPQCFYVNNESSNDATMIYKTVSPVAVGTFGNTANQQSVLVTSTNSVPNITPDATSTVNTHAVEHVPSTSRRVSATATTSVSSVISSTGVLCCDVCKVVGIATNLVKCDECQKNYHFTCLDPPLKKTPKKRGYSWHCADCDPTGSE